MSSNIPQPADCDSKDRYTSHNPVSDYTAWMLDGVKGLRVGLNKWLPQTQDIHPNFRGAIETSQGIFRELGAKAKEASIPFA